MDIKELRIVVVCGGISSEREVSLRSGKAVFEALGRSGYKNITLFDLTRENLDELLNIHMDLAFLALHGKGGEDGAIQGMLSLAGIPYTGSDIEASAICINKIRTKELLAYAGLPTPKFISLSASEALNEKQRTEELITRLGLPMVLKSPCEGSSIGVFIAKSQDEVLFAMREVFKYGNELLAEQFLCGMELTLPILGNNDPIVLPTVEITSENEFYDYTAKYTQGMCHHIIPARISDELKDEIGEIGKRAYKVLGCTGLSRIDFMLDKQNSPMIIEVNTLPGMTDMSLFPDSARHAGISFEDLVDRIVVLALEKHQKMAK